MGVFMEMDAGWLVGGLRVFGNLVRWPWEALARRVQEGECDRVFMVEGLGSGVLFAQNISFGNRTNVRSMKKN